MLEGVERTNWTEERTELLKKLWLEGLSASQIAGVLGEGVTRNGVIGKVHRLKLTGPIKTGARAGRPKVQQPATQAPRSPRVPTASKKQAHKAKNEEVQEVETFLLPVVQELYIPEDQRIGSVNGLNEHTCKWPIGDPLTPDFYFCGQSPEDGKPYCEFHSRRAYHQTEKKPARRYA